VSRKADVAGDVVMEASIVTSQRHNYVASYTEAA